MADYAAEWAGTTLLLSRLALSTKKLYASRIASSLGPTLGNLKLADADARAIEDWRRRLASVRTSKGMPLSASTQHTDFVILTKILDTAERDGLVAYNPCRKVARPKVGRTEVGFLGADQVEALLTAVQGEPLEPLARFVADTGCRIGEALALRWEDVDLEQSQAVIKRGGLGSATTKTPAGQRVIPLVEEVVTTLQAWRSEQRRQRLTLGSGWGDHEDLVFTSAVGTPLDPRNARRSLRVVLRRIGLPTQRPWHTLRHSLATRLLNRGTPMPVVSSIIGHSSIRTTVDLYGHPEPAISAAAMSKAMGRRTGAGKSND